MQERQVEKERRKGEGEARKENGLHVIALIGGKRGALTEIADNCIVVEETHYGRAEDCQMGIAHMICYAFMENPGLME